MNEQSASGAGAGGQMSPGTHLLTSTQNAIAARPLYLSGTSGAMVDVNGPALLVRAPRRADARYPLGRISRVIADHRVQWRTRAVLACLNHGIPIVVGNAHGVPLGYVLPAKRTPSRLDRAIDEFLDRSDWREHHACWLRAERARLLVQWRRRQEVNGSPVPGEDVRELKRLYVYQGTRPEITDQFGLLPAVIRAMVAELGRKAGLRATYWGFGGIPLSLVEDLSELLEFALYLELRGLGEAARFDPPALLRVFHAFAPTMKCLYGDFLGRLHRRIASLLEEWR